MPESQTEQWRYRCPEGHTSWKRYSDHYYCQPCGVTFEQLKDMKTEGRNA